MNYSCSVRSHYDDGLRAQAICLRLGLCFFFFFPFHCVMLRQITMKLKAGTAYPFEAELPWEHSHPHPQDRQLEIKKRLDLLLYGQWFSATQPVLDTFSIKTCKRCQTERQAKSIAMICTKLIPNPFRCSHTLQWFTETASKKEASLLLRSKTLGVGSHCRQKDDGITH